MVRLAALSQHHRAPFQIHPLSTLDPLLRVPWRRRTCTRLRCATTPPSHPLCHCAHVPTLCRLRLPLPCPSRHSFIPRNFHRPSKPWHLRRWTARQPGIQGCPHSRCITESGIKIPCHLSIIMPLLLLQHKHQCHLRRHHRCPCLSRPLSFRARMCRAQTLQAELFNARRAGPLPSASLGLTLSHRL
jgi:hypothetical protein